MAGRAPRGAGGPQGQATSIEVAPTPRDKSQVHTLEWNVKEVTVGFGPTRKSILNHIAGKTQSGELTAIMGPSGAGKTTLLDAISLRNRNFEGAVHYDGKPPGGEFYTTSVLVHQKELLFGFMTPREHLTFFAIARMSRKHSYKDMMMRVEEVLREVKLEKCADTIVGGTDPIYMKKGLSGGERKRLAIAAELLLAPSIIFLDEPSSGLDSVMSENIFATMKELTYKGRMVIASVHCPSSETCHSFTHLILLSCDGRLAYHGPGDKALAYFTKLGFKCPMSYNPADWYLKQISMAPGAEPEGERARMDLLVGEFTKTPWYLDIPLMADEAHKRFRPVYGLQANLFTLFRINLWRCSIQLRRDWVTFVLWGFVSALIGGLFGILFWQQAAANWRNLLGLLFSVVVANLFTAALATMVRFPLDWAIVVREYFSGANALGPYLTARFIMDFPLGYGPFILITLIYWMTGMDPDLFRFIVTACTFCSCNWAAASLGMYVSSFSSNPFIGLTLLPAFVAPMIMFSGILYEKQSVPVWLAWLESVSLVNYGFGSLLAQQIHILPQAWAKYLLLFTQVDVTKWAYNIGMLWAMNFTFQVLTYVNLSLRMRFVTNG